MDKTKTVTVASFTTLGEAMVVKGLMDSAGIDSFLLHDTLAGILPFESEAFSVQLCVNEADEARARELLAAKVDPREFAAEADASRGE